MKRAGQRPPRPRPAELDRHVRARPRGAGLIAAPPPGQRALSSAEGVVVGAPRRRLGLEGLVLLAGALIAFDILGQPWWLLPAGSSPPTSPTSAALLAPPAA